MYPSYGKHSSGLPSLSLSSVVYLSDSSSFKNGISKSPCVNFLYPQWMNMRSGCVVWLLQYMYALNAVSLILSFPSTFAPLAS